MPTSTGQNRDAAHRLRAIAAGLAAAGLATRLHESPAELHLTATLHQSGQREIEVVVGEDGYTEFRYWASLDLPPGHAVATIVGALAAIVPALRFAPLADVARRPNDGVTSYDGAVTQRVGEGGMPGPQDHVVEQERSPDVARPREADQPRESRVQPTDLQARLERLPVGHPSSPYGDDGSRKPPPPDLAPYELPLPDELPPDAAQSDADLRAQNAGDVGLDGSSRREGRELTPERSRIADQALAKCHDAEGRGMDGSYGNYGLTPAMRRIEAQLDHGQLAADIEGFALKEPNRFKEKFARLIERYPGADPNELVSSIHDGVRYTFIFDFEHYTEGVEIGQERLTNAGYDHIETKPSWASEEYKGVNSQWRDPSTSVMFEVQFHTQESWDAKQKTHESYEKIQARGTSIEDVERLRAYQRAVSAEVRIPPGALPIQPYKKER
jgi:hypothetical protein